MKILVALAISTATLISSCWSEPICTDEFRMVTLQVRSHNHQPVTLDSAYTIRAGNGERISYPQQSPGYYTVLDDSYHPHLRRKKDNFTFHGFQGGVKVVEEVFQISADQCHINKEAGKDSVFVQ